MQISMNPVRLSFALALTALALAAPVAHAQGSPVPYWTTAWPAGFGSSFAAAQASSSYSSLAPLDLSALDGGAAVRSSFSSRFDLPNGWFVGSQSGGAGLNGLGSAWSGMPSFAYNSTQVGYNFANASVPVSIYAGLDTLKYNTPAIGSPFAALDSSSSNAVQTYGVHAGVEFRPTSNLSLSFGASFAQQPGDLNAAMLPGATPFAFGARR